MGQKKIVMDEPFQTSKEDNKWRVLQLDPKTIYPTTILSNAAWFYGENDPKKAAHSHNIGEVVAYFGSDWEHPEDLGGQVTIYMNGEKHVFTKSFMMYAPVGLPHCPYTIDRVDRPLYHTAFPVGKTIKSDRYPDMIVSENVSSNPKYDYCFVDEMKGRKTPVSEGEVPILHLDSSFCEYAPELELTWFTKPGIQNAFGNEELDRDRLYLFMGSDWENALDLKAEIELTVGGSTIVIDKPCYFFAPAGTKIGSMNITKLEQPVMVNWISPDAEDPYYPLNTGKTEA